MDNTKKGVLTGLKISVLGIGAMGEVISIEQPDIEFETVNDVSTGRLKPLFTTIKLGDYNNAILQQALQNNSKPKNRLPFLIKGNIRINSEDVSLVIMARGEVQNVKDGTLEVGKGTERELKIKLDTYSKNVDSIPEITIDEPNNIFLINGIDQYADYRANLS